MVTMVHPKLPGREIEVPEVGVRARERSGWQRKPDDTGEPAAAEQPEPDQVEPDTEPDN